MLVSCSAKWQWISITVQHEGQVKTARPKPSDQQLEQMIKITVH